jgi:polysaccharide biosynthesis transport protein
MVAPSDSRESRRSSARSTNEQMVAPDLNSLFSAFRRRWFLATTLGLAVGVGAAIIAWSVLPAPYTATSQLQISVVTERPLLSRRAEEQAAFDIYKQTQMYQVRSQQVLRDVLRQPGKHGQPPIAQLRMIREQKHPEDWLQENLEVTSAGTEFIQIALSGENPVEIAAVVNAVTEAFLRNAGNAEQFRRTARLKTLEEFARKQETQLRLKRGELRKLAEELRTGDPATLSLKQQTADTFLNELRINAAKLQFELMNAEIQLKSRESGQAGEQVEVPQPLIDAKLAEDPEYRRIKDRIAQLEKVIEEYGQVIRSGRSSHPTVQRYLNEIERQKSNLELLRTEKHPLIVQEIRRESQDRLEVSDAELRRQIVMQKQYLENYERQLAEQERSEQNTVVLSFELERLRREIADAEQARKVALDEITNLQQLLNSEPRIQLDREAGVPYARDFKKKYAMTGMAGLGGFVVIIAGIVWLEFLARRISSTTEVANGLRMRVIGTLPLMPQSANGRSSRRSRNRNAFWHGVFKESMDAARTLLLRDAVEGDLSVVMVTSAMSGEGKSTFAGHLATSLARAGRRTVLVDGDLRWPTLHKVVNEPQSPGFCEVLRGEAEVKDVIRPMSDGLALIPAGTIDQRVLKILAGSGVDGFFAELKREFEFIVVDTSPILPVTDPLLIGQSVDAVIFSVRRDVSRFSKVESACQRLTMLGIPVIGAVIIGLDEGHYGYKDHRRYQYASSGERVLART